MKLSTTFHPQKNSQAEVTVKYLKDTLKDCVIYLMCNWDDYLTLIEFSYNNNYHSRIQMAPYEGLYGRRCRSPFLWVGEGGLIERDLLHQAMEKVNVIQERLNTAQSH